MDLNSEVQNKINNELVKIYSWVLLGLIVSTVSSYVLQFYWIKLDYHLGRNPEYLGYVFTFEIVLFAVVKFLLKRIGTGITIPIFLFYSIINGIPLTAVFLIFNLGHFYLIFLLSALMFLIPAASYLIFKIDISHLWGVILLFVPGAASAIIICMHLKAGTIYWVVSLVTVVYFLILALRERIDVINLFENPQQDGTGYVIPIKAALNLYINFIILFVIIDRFIESGSIGFSSDDEEDAGGTS